MCAVLCVDVGVVCMWGVVCSVVFVCVMLCVEVLCAGIGIVWMWGVVLCEVVFMWVLWVWV